MTTDNPIKIDQMTFEYKNQTVFKNFRLSVPGNQFIGLIGANGCGKSTLLKLFTGRLKAKEGTILIFDQSPDSLTNKYVVGSSFQEVDFPATEKIEEVLNFVCKQYPDPFPVERLIKDFNLSEFRSKRCGQLSGGMKRRLALACAFAGQPKIVLLDEPTTGLDLESRHNLVNNIKAYQASHQALVIMISHHPDEVIDSVDQFFHLKEGTLQRISTDKMRELSTIRKIQFKATPDLELPEALQVDYKEGQYSVLCGNSDLWVSELTKRNISFSNLLVRPLGSEELMLEVL